MIARDAPAADKSAPAGAAADAAPPARPPPPPPSSDAERDELDHGDTDTGADSPAHVPLRTRLDFLAAAQATLLVEEQRARAEHAADMARLERRVRDLELARNADALRVVRAETWCLQLKSALLGSSGDAPPPAGGVTPARSGSSSTFVAIAPRPPPPAAPLAITAEQPLAETHPPSPATVQITQAAIANADRNTFLVREAATGRLLDSGALARSALFARLAGRRWHFAADDYVLHADRQGGFGGSDDDNGGDGGTENAVPASARLVARLMMQLHELVGERPRVSKRVRSGAIELWWEAE